MALRRYAGRRLSSDQLDDLVLRATDDAGLAAIKGAAWTLYSDLEDHFADGSHSLSTTQKKDIARWIVFLKSDFRVCVSQTLTRGICARTIFLASTEPVVIWCIRAMVGVEGSRLR